MRDDDMVGWTAEEEETTSRQDQLSGQITSPGT